MPQQLMREGNPYRKTSSPGHTDDATGECPALLTTEAELERLNTLQRELALIVRRVTGKTLGSTDEAVREMHVGLKRAADYLTQVRHEIAHYITNLPLGSRPAAKIDLRQQVNSILVPICNNLDHLKAAAKFTLLLDITLLDRNIKRLNQLKVKLLNNHL